MKFGIKNINFTRNEAKIILFMIIVLFFGFTIKYVSFVAVSSKTAAFDYSKSDEQFKKLSRAGLNQSVLDSAYQKDSSVTTQDNSLKQSLKNAEDSLKTKDKKKSKKEEKLKPKSININTATKETLTLLPGVGESTADKIIQYRDTHKGFKKIENIMKVKGIGKKKFEKLKDYITVE